MPLALVVGGASGIGRATCAALARDGFTVAVADRDLDGARSVATAVRGHAYAIDVAVEQSVVDGFAAVVAALGGLDALAIPAGIGETTPLLDLDVATFRRVLEINLIGTWLCIREAARHMRAGGRICAVASVAGKLGGGLTGTAAYAASKGGVLALVRNAARVLAARGIAVNCVAPGPVMTPMLAEAFADPAHKARVEGMTALGRAGEPEEIAEAIAWLLSAKSSFVHGESLTIDGGLVMD